MKEKKNRENLVQLLRNSDCFWY